MEFAGYHVPIVLEIIISRTRLHPLVSVYIGTNLCIKLGSRALSTNFTDHAVFKGLGVGRCKGE